MKKLNIEIVLFLFEIFCYFISKVNSFERFQGFNLLSGNILLITNIGIKLYDTSLEKTNDVLNMTLNPDTFYFNSFVQFPLEQGGYIILKMLNSLYLINKEVTEILSQDTKNEINGIYSKLITYKSHNNKLYCFVGFINNNNKLKIFVYNIENSKLQLDYEVINEEIQNFNLNSISCEIMLSSFNQNKTSLICFTSDKNALKLVVTAYDPENNLSYINSLTNDIANDELSFINSCTSKNKLIAFVCFSQDVFGSKCVLYDSKNNIWSEHMTLASTLCISYHLDVSYSKENNEYYVYFFFGFNEFYFYKFDEYFNLKCSNEGKCIFRYQINQCTETGFSTAFIENKGLYLLYLSCETDDTLQKIDLNGENNLDFEYTKFNIKNDSLLYSTMLIPSSDDSPTSILTTSLLSDTAIFSSLISTELESPSS